MTNEEKAKDIARLCPSCLTDGINSCSECEKAGKYLGALEMAEWKDGQFKEYLEEKASEAKYKRDADTSFDNDWDMWNNRYWVYMAIINELFKKEQK